MMKRLLNNKKGAAEIVGSVMFIIILLFFFTNVYLWHDAAVKEMNDLYAEKMNSLISIVGYDSVNKIVTLKNNGGADATIECYWLNHGMTEIPDNWQDNDKVVPAGSSLELHLSTVPNPLEIIKVITTTGNIAIFRP
jgi:hypothetical protein